MNEEKLTRSHRHTIKGIDGLQMELDILYNNISMLKGEVEELKNICLMKK